MSLLVDIVAYLAQMQYNIKYYPWYYAAASFLAWLPVFFLYFSSVLSLKEVLQLEALYYIAVVFLEVPTGYLSDRVGRKKTLLLGGVSLCLACVFFLIGVNFWILAIGQLMFALYMSFVSGTSTVFHYESLQQVGRGDDYGAREAYTHKYGMLAGGTAALLGGWLASYDLHYAYWATLIGAVISLGIALGFTEPSRDSEDIAESNPWAQIKVTLSFLKWKYLAWIFIFYVVIFAISHVPYEFYQPYLELLSERDMLYGISVPVLSGVIYAGARYVGAFGASTSISLSERFGLPNFLIFHLVFILLIVFAMSFTLHTAVAILVILRSIPWAAIKPPINAIITPAIDAGQRATFHSVLSLMCRLSFFLTLWLLSMVVDHADLATWDNLQTLLRYCVIGGLVFLMPLALTAHRYLLHTEST